MCFIQGERGDPGYQGDIGIVGETVYLLCLSLIFS